MSKIEYPARESEFEIQADIYNRLRKEGFNIRGEVRGTLEGDYNAQFDLVVFTNNYKPLCVIEVKSWKYPRDLKEYETKQTKKYKKFGYPVLVCGKKKQISQIVQEIKNLINLKP